jgi:hypothetical protein
VAWCPNCDEIRNVAADAACPVCSAATLDAGRLRAPAAVAVAVLELAPEAPPVSADEPAEFWVRPTLPRRTLIAGLAVFAIAAGGVAVTKLTASPKAKPAAPAIPEASSEPIAETSSSPVPQPPFGTALAGALTLAAEDTISRVDLTTGETVTAPVADSSGWFKAVSKDGRSFAYRDDAGMLWVVPNLSGAAPAALVSDASDYVFTEDGQSMIVHRTEFVTNDVTRSRIERRAVDFSRTDLLFETTRPVSGIWWRRGTLLIRMSDGKNDGIYEVTGRTKARLLRNRTSVLDISADGEQVLVGPERTGPGLWVLEVATKAVKQVGPTNLLVGSAAFSADGKTIALTGTTNYEITRICGDGGECGSDYVWNDSSVFRAAAGSKALKKLFAGTSLGPVAWGPGDWIFFLNNGTVTATRGDGADHTMTTIGEHSPNLLVYGT